MPSTTDHRVRIVSRKIDTLLLLPKKKRALHAAVQELLQNSKVQGVGVYGSTTRGVSDPRDIDLIVLVPGNENWTRRRFYDGLSIHIQLRGIKRFREMNLTRRQLRSEHTQAYAYLRSLWDSTGLITAVRARARHQQAHGPKPVSKWEVGRLRAEVTTLLEDLEKAASDPTLFTLLGAPTLARYIAIHFRLRGQWVPREKDLLDALTATDKRLAARYRKALSLLHDPTACLKVTHPLAAEVLAPVGGQVKDFEVWYRK